MAKSRVRIPPMPLPEDDPGVAGPSALNALLAPQPPIEDILRQVGVLLSRLGPNCPIVAMTRITRGADAIAQIRKMVLAVGDEPDPPADEGPAN